ncbi:MAG: nucleotidyl transferase AbiEii/AbiGii toxin family protein [Phycisphaerae bacterium]|nr:MAG: nucleotidyl transferase AbiEii/AbiGii toxin family protein [Planctomycetota bacterium]MBE7457833.1 nucleotidyl transferase AbiEii/AbiGii toxin family protein [Planctomycetia bacterium]MCL4719104.1 nucleotidyl transferase AbiEii/AbiGii toxin family protein [Phycisphaerae bacterium]
MRLFEHPDFEQAILRAAEHFRARGLRPAIIEKDYFVTEALRIIADTATDQVIFKGGTSLSKGWNLIERFSEDIDLFLDPLAFKPPLGKQGIDRELKRLRDAIGRHPALTFVRDESRTIGGFGRSDRFAYEQRFGGPGEVVGRVLLESGTASGREPTADMAIRSYLGQFLEETGVTLGADDERPFTMRLLHFRRTFVEKMFAIHAKVEILKRDGQPIGSYARHYYDLFRLAAQPEVRAMLATPEYAAIKEDYDRISRAHFERDYFHPEGMSFARCEALFPTEALAEALARDYEQQCRTLCYVAFPTWAEVRARFDELRASL